MGYLNLTPKLSYIFKQIKFEATSLLQFFLDNIFHHAHGLQQTDHLLLRRTLLQTHCTQKNALTQFRIQKKEITFTLPKNRNKRDTNLYIVKRKGEKVLDNEN